jgi:hypothetical protein
VVVIAHQAMTGNPQLVPLNVLVQNLKKDLPVLIRDKLVVR